VQKAIHFAVDLTDSKTPLADILFSNATKAKQTA